MSKSVLDDKEKLVLELLFTEECKGDVQKAAKLAGLEGDFSKALTVGIRHKTEEFLHLNAPKAALKLLLLLENPSLPGAKTQLTAIKEVLGITGIFQREDKQANTIIQPVIMLPDKRPLSSLGDHEKILIEAKSYDVVQASETQAETLKGRITPVTDIPLVEISRTRKEDDAGPSSSHH